jgi:hypothetical protein
MKGFLTGLGSAVREGVRAGYEQRTGTEGSSV